MRRTRQYIIVILVLLIIVLNVLANTIPLGGNNTGDLSDRFKVFFVPEGYVFSIWGVIYIGLIAFAVFQALPAQMNNPRLQSIFWCFIISAFGNILWLILWHYELFLLTLIAMFGLLICLIIIYERLEIGKSKVNSQERWFVRAPFSIYMGWITVAAIANVTQVLYFYNWSGWGILSPVWAVVMLVIAAIIGSMIQSTRNDYLFNLVLIWAFVGIAIKHFNELYVFYAAVIASGWLVIFIIFRFFLRSKSGADEDDELAKIYDKYGKKTG